jgi:hypothetical protein
MLIIAVSQSLMAFSCLTPSRKSCEISIPRPQLGGPIRFPTSPLRKCVKHLSGVFLQAQAAAADRGEFSILKFGGGPYQGGPLLIDPRRKSEKISVGSLQGRGRVGVPLGYCLPGPKILQARIGAGPEQRAVGAGAPQGQVVDGNADPSQGTHQAPYPNAPLISVCL